MNALYGFFIGLSFATLMYDKGNEFTAPVMLVLTAVLIGRNILAYSRKS